jgi:hypothetical protein
MMIEKFIYLLGPLAEKYRQCEAHFMGGVFLWHNG